jgi:hypothetical protein
MDEGIEWIAFTEMLCGRCGRWQPESAVYCDDKAGHINPFRCKDKADCGKARTKHRRNIR